MSVALCFNTERGNKPQNELETKRRKNETL